MKQLLEAIAVTAELTSTDLSKIAARVMAEDLARYPLDQVLGALTRCRRELKGRLTIADVVQRLDDGRPGPEEAWAMIPKGEGPSVVWTQEMAEAFGVAYPLMESDEVAARMAFKESYSKAVALARDASKPVHWMPSLGHDPAGREVALLQAVEKKRLTADRARALMPQLQASPQFTALLAGAKPLPMLAPVEQPVGRLALPRPHIRPMELADEELEEKRLAEADVAAREAARLPG